MAIIIEFSRRDIRILEEAITDKVKAVVRKKGLWRYNEDYPFSIHLLSGHRWSISVDSGSVVHIYITGINILGGEYSILSPEFWQSMERAIKLIPKMFVWSDLEAKGIIKITLQDKLDQHKAWKVGRGEAPELVKETEIQKIKTITTYRHIPSGIVTNINHQGNEFQADKEARIKLTQMYYEKLDSEGYEDE